MCQRTQRYRAPAMSATSYNTSVSILATLTCVSKDTALSCPSHVRHVLQHQRLAATQRCQTREQPELSETSECLPSGSPPFPPPPPPPPRVAGQPAHRLIARGQTDQRASTKETIAMLAFPLSTSESVLFFFVGFYIVSVDFSCFLFLFFGGCFFFFWGGGVTFY